MYPLSSLVTQAISRVGLVSLGLLSGLVAAQPNESIPVDAAETARSPGPLPSSYQSLDVYLRRVDGKWTVSLKGNLKDPDTEKINVPLTASGTLRVLSALPPAASGSKLCLTKMKDREQYGYLDCNSAFHSVNAASSTAATVLRGVLSLGILTVADAATGSTGYTVSLDRQALEAAAVEAGAYEFAKASAPLMEYRERFRKADTALKLQQFIVRYAPSNDPEALVAKAQEMLPAVIEREEFKAREEAELAARKAEARRQEDLQRQAQQQAEMEGLQRFQANVRPGDRVIVRGKGPSITDIDYYALVIDVKPPLAYLQFEIVSPQMKWVRIEALLPAR